MLLMCVYENVGDRVEVITLSTLVHEVFIFLPQDSQYAIDTNRVLFKIRVHDIRD